MNLIQEIKQKANLPELISRNHSLKKVGNKWIGLCPFHNEKTPSFNVFEKSYKCFGCGAKGDAIDWVQHRDKVNNIQAISSLARFYNIKTNSTVNSPPVVGKTLKQRLSYCIKKLPINELCVEILKDLNPKIRGFLYVFSSPIDEKVKELEVLKKFYDYPDGAMGLTLAVEKYEALIKKLS